MRSRHKERLIAVKNPNNNRPLLSSKNPHFQNEATCTTVLVKMSFICMRMKIISIWKAEHLTSFPYRGPGELGNGLLYVFLEKVNTFFFPIGQFQKISIPNHGRLPCFNPPLPSEIPKCVTPPCPQNSIIMNLPYLSEFPFFWKYIFDLAMPIWTNEHEFMPPQGCDLAAPGDKLYSSVTRKTYR